MTTMKITDLMAVALQSAVPMGDEQRIPMQFTGYAGTTKGLVARGLAENRFIANGDLPGYEGRYPKVKNYHLVLTPRGEAMRRRLAKDPSLKSVRTEELDRMAEPVTTACGSLNPDNEKHACKRESGHPGDCRPTISYVSSQAHWSAPVAAEPTCGRKIDPRQIINEAPSELVCARIEGHRGQHRDTVELTQHSFVWDDDACLPEPVKVVKVVKCESCGLRTADGSEYHPTCRPIDSPVSGKIRKITGASAFGDDTPTIVWEDRSNRANVREISEVLKAAGFLPRNGERVMARSGYAASRDGNRVLVAWRGGSDPDLMGSRAIRELRTAMNDAYAAVLEAAGYPLGKRESGYAVYVTGAKRKR